MSTAISYSLIGLKNLKEAMDTLGSGLGSYDTIDSGVAKWVSSGRLRRAPNVLRVTRKCTKVLQ